MFFMKQCSPQFVASQLPQITNVKAAQDFFQNIIPNAQSNIYQAYPDSLIKSIPKCVKTLIDAESMYTKY